MVKIRYTTYYPRIKVREAEIWNVVLSEDKYGLAVHYERCAGNPGLHYSVLNTYMNSEGFVELITSLVINDTEYRAEKIRKHYAEVQVLLDQERMKNLLQEIEW